MNDGGLQNQQNSNIIQKQQEVIEFEKHKAEIVEGSLSVAFVSPI